MNGPPSSERALLTPPSSLSPPGLWQAGGTGLLRKSGGTPLAGESGNRGLSSGQGRRDGWDPLPQQRPDSGPDAAQWGEGREAAVKMQVAVTQGSRRQGKRGGGGGRTGPTALKVEKSP